MPWSICPPRCRCCWSTAIRRRPTPAILDVALSPGGQVITGHEAGDRNAAFLATKPLARFQSISLANVDRLDRSAMTPWSSTSATAAAWPSSSASGPTTALSTRRSIATARGCFPCRWPARPSCWPIAWRRRRTWRWTPAHFIFRVFAEDRNSFLGTVLVERYFAAAAGWRPPTGSARPACWPGCATAHRWWSSGVSARGEWWRF